MNGNPRTLFKRPGDLHVDAATDAGWPLGVGLFGSGHAAYMRKALRYTNGSGLSAIQGPQSSTGTAVSAPLGLEAYGLAPPDADPAWTPRVRAQLPEPQPLRSNATSLEPRDPAPGSAFDPVGTIGQLEPIRREAAAAPTQAAYRPQAGDANLLARLLFAEGGGTPGDLEALGWAVVNRAGQREFGPDLNAVVHQRNGFQSVPGGGGPPGGSPRWRMSEHPEALGGSEARAWAKANATADGILNGRISDPTRGATFFFSDDDFDGSPEKAPGGFRSMLARGALSSSPYKSRASGSTKNYFFTENKKPSRERK